MVGVKTVFCLTLLGLANAGIHDIYKGFEVHGVVLKTTADLELLWHLETTLDLDVWQHGAPQLRDAQVMVSPEQKDSFLQQLDSNGVEHYLKMDDIPSAFEEFDAERERFRNSPLGREALPFAHYPTYEEVDAYMEEIAAQYPDIVTLVTAGPSFEGRIIKYLKISTTNFADTSKPIYFMDAMIHAREWVTTPVALYSIHRLVAELRAEDSDLLDSTDWIIMPMVNPDGYEYTRTVRLWRRTRSFTPSVSEDCYGIDANRNFDVAFNTLGVSANPCSDVYPGITAFSEPETGYVRDILWEYLDRIQVYQNIHSHGNWVLFGFGNMTLPDNGMSLFHMGAIMGAAIDAVKLPQAPYYLVGNSALLLYSTSGSAQDYAQSIGVPFSYTLELPGLGYDFRVPETYISQINEETWRGIAAQARAARIHYDARVAQTNP